MLKNKLNRKNKNKIKKKIRKKLKVDSGLKRDLEKQQLLNFLDSQETSHNKEEQNLEKIPEQFQKVIENFYNQHQIYKEPEITETNKQEQNPQEQLEKTQQQKISKKSRKKIKKEKKNQVAQLKVLAERPELVEAHDVNSPNPFLLLHLKGYKNTIEVPKNWEYKKKQFFFKKGLYKQLYKLPNYIENTGIGKLRDPLAEKNTMRMIRIKLKERMNPRLGKIDIDYDILHDAFFKYQTRPEISKFGDIYYEGREEEQKMSKFKPGKISQELRNALGIAPNEYPPWIYNMQKFGPPPSYPNLQIPGIGENINFLETKKQQQNFNEYEFDENYLWGQISDKRNEIQELEGKMEEEEVKELNQNEFMKLKDLEYVKDMEFADN